MLQAAHALSQHLDVRAEDAAEFAPETAALPGVEVLLVVSSCSGSGQLPPSATRCGNAVLAQSSPFTTQLL